MDAQLQKTIALIAFINLKKRKYKKMYKINETKKKGNYTIVTLALRIPMVEWLDSKGTNRSETIRNLIIKAMKKDKTK